MCPNCNTLNNEDARFCQRCGLSFQTGYKEIILPEPPPVKQAPTPTATISAFIFLFLLLIWPGWIWTIIGGVSRVATSTTPSTESISSIIDQISSETNSLKLLNWETKAGEYSSSVVGKIKNEGTKAVSYAHITFIVYDAEGNQIGTALDNINNLEAGATWAFSAMVLQDNAANVKLGDIISY